MRWASVASAVSVALLWVVSIPSIGVTSAEVTTTTTTSLDHYITPINSKVFSILLGFTQHLQQDQPPQQQSDARQSASAEISDPYTGPFRFAGSVPSVQAWLEETMAEGHRPPQNLVPRLFFFLFCLACLIVNPENA